jgi:hypothetical protein
MQSAIDERWSGFWQGGRRDVHLGMAGHRQK